MGSTSDFSTNLIRDARLNDVSSSIEYGVRQGASQLTYQAFNANTSSSSNLTFNITPPSESVVIDRRVLIRAKVKVQILLDGTNTLNGTNYFEYGSRDGFKSFPLSSLFTTCTATINNTSVSINLQDVLPALLRQMDMEDLAYYQGMTPIALDKYKKYSDAVNQNNNPLGAYGQSSYNNHWLPRGCHPIENVLIKRFAPANADYPDGVPDDNSSTATANGDKFNITFDATFTEPLWISPFILHSKYNQAGMLGVNNINLNFNIDSTLRQFWATSLPANVNYTVQLQQAEPFDAKILLNYLTPQATNLLPARNIVPFVDFPRYITSANNTDELAAGTRATYTLNNIQLNQVPDKIYVIARKALSSQSYRDSSTFFTIEKITVNFNNASGLLSSAQQQDLWRMSVANNSKQTWYDFSGKYGMVNADRYVYSEGSVLVLDPAMNFSLPNYLSNGSIGQYSLQMEVTLFNNSAENLKPEFVVIVANSGLFATIAGSSVVRTGLLNMDIVSQLASTGQESAVSSSDYKELSGGAMSDQIASALKGLPLKGKGARSGGMAPRSKLDMLSY